MKLIDPIPLLGDWHAPVAIDHLRSSRTTRSSRRHSRAVWLWPALWTLGIVAIISWMMLQSLANLH